MVRLLHKLTMATVLLAAQSLMGNAPSRGDDVAGATAAAQKLPRVAAITTTYYHNSHADVLISRLLEGNSLDGKGDFPRLKLASLYIDQVSSDKPGFRDVGRDLAARHRVPLAASVSEALTLGTGKLAVDGVLIIAEHGVYPLAPDGQIQYPKRRFAEEVIKVFESSGRSVPVFNDKHLADTWEDAKWFYDASQRLHFPLMAGSSVPVTWRKIDEAVKPGQKLKECLALNYGPLEGYGFHALEALQCLIEQRHNSQRSGDNRGETGVRAVRHLSGNAAWAALKPDVFDRELLMHLLGSLQERPWPAGKTPEEVVKDPPVLFQIEYRDGLKASVLTLDWHVADWAVACRDAETGKLSSTVFWTQEWRPLQHFAFQLAGVERMMHSGVPSWPVERTLLTTGILDALFTAQPSPEWRATPQLVVEYRTDWKFQQQPPPPPNRPLDGQ